MPTSWVWCDLWSTGTLPASWGNLTGLTTLVLPKNNFTGKLPPSWGALSKLRTARLWGNSLNGPLPAAWSGMLALEEIQYNSNSLTGRSRPSGFCSPWDKMPSAPPSAHSPQRRHPALIPA
jgi:hypothetical protein